MGRKPRRQPDPKTAVAYLRVSTDTTRQELGEAGQRAAIEAWARREGVTVALWLTEEVSGGAKRDDRPVLLQAVAEVAQRRCRWLAFSTLDRFSRDPLTAELVRDELARSGAETVFADGHGNGDDPTSEMVRGIRLVVARFERRMIGARIKAALAVKRARGEMTGAPRYGWKLAADGKHVELNPSEAAIVKTVRHMAAKRSVRNIAAELAARGVVGRTGKPLTRDAVWQMTRARDEKRH